MAGLLGLLGVGAIFLPLLANPASATGARPRATPSIAKQLAELKGSDTVADDGFGVSVATSGPTAIVGAPGCLKAAGRAYLFTNSATGWKQAIELKGSDTVADDYLGYSVAISGATVVVGAPGYAKKAGRVYVFANTVSGWKQSAELKGSDTVAGDAFGYSVAISGTTAVVGAPNHAKDAGRAYVFTTTASGWKQAVELKGSDTVAGDGFGVAVAISGASVIAGAPGYAKDAGRAYVFTTTASGWKQAAELKGSDTVAGDGFGYSAVASGTTAIVGAPSHAKNAGRAYVFTNTASDWKQAAELKGSDTVADDGFGFSVAISGATVIAGVPGYAKNAGRAYVFTNAATGWKQAVELKGADGVADDDLGYSVAVSGTTALVGAPNHAKEAGRAYVFAT
jgi:drug/metabolite transporter superfamily protein YnfA